MNWTKYILSALACMALFTSCKDDEINTQLKTSTWVFKGVAHKTDYVSSGPGWLYAVEQKDGKISELEINFFGGALPTNGGQYLVVDTLKNLNEVMIRTFEKSNLDTNYYSRGASAQDSVVVTIINNRVNVIGSEIDMYSNKDTAIHQLDLNIQQRY